MKPELDQRLIDAAVEQALSRFPDGYAGAAAAYLEDGSIVTSVCFDAHNDVVNLCHETGAICEANRRGSKVVASVCVSRAKPEDRFVILTPCGVCQERLSVWGMDVQVATPDPVDSGNWIAKTLSEVQPYHWTNIPEAWDWPIQRQLLTPKLK